MPDYFKKILIPIDLSINTEVAVKKGLEIADTGTVIHLLYVHNFALPGITGIVKRYLGEIDELPNHKSIERKLNQWKETIEESNSDITAHTWIVLEDSIQKAIEKKANQLGADLIIIGKNSHHSWFPVLNTIVPSKLAQKTGIGVLTVKPGAIYNKIKTVVVAITNETAKHKMEAISAICRKFKVKIYLVTFMNRDNKPSGFSASSMLQVYQSLKSIYCPVEYTVLDGHNRAKAILDYAKKINADILLVEPETETKISWPNKHISDVLPVKSKVQVWAV